jgi:hypothetical protein
VEELQKSLHERQVQLSGGSTRRSTRQSKVARRIDCSAIETVNLERGVQRLQLESKRRGGVDFPKMILSSQQPTSHDPCGLMRGLVMAIQ